MIKFIKVNTIKPRTLFNTEQIVTMYIPVSSIHSITYNYSTCQSIIKLVGDLETEIVLKGYYNTDVIEKLLFKSKLNIISLENNQNSSKKINKKIISEKDDESNEDEQSEKSNDENESESIEESNEEDEESNEDEESDNDDAELSKYIKKNK